MVTNKQKLVRYPLLMPAIIFSTGTAIGATTQANPYPILYAGIGCFVLYLCLLPFLKRISFGERLGTFFIYATLFIIALANAMHSKQVELYDFETVLEMAEESSNATFVGRISEAPRRFTTKRGTGGLDFKFDIHELPDDFGGSKITPTQISVVWFGPKTIGTLESNIPMVELGDGWQLHGKLTYEENYYGNVELKLTVSGSDKQCFRDERYDLPFPLSTLSSMRSYASEILSLGSEGKWLNASIVKTMVLGYGSDIPYKTRQIFRQSGTVHVFAISGLHVGIVATIVVLLLSITRLNPIIRTLIFSLIIIAYTIATGASPSTIRACIMSLIFYSAMLVGRRTMLLSTIAATALITQIINPLQIINIGYILSFVCIIGIALFAPPLVGLSERLKEAISSAYTRHKLKAAEARVGAIEADLNSGIWQCRWEQIRELFFVKVVFDMVRQIPEGLAVSIAVFIASIPATGYLFNQITPISILCNILVIPLAFLIVLTAALSMLSGIFSYELAIIFNSANIAFTDWLIKIAEFGAELPGATVQLPGWSLSATIISAAIILLIAFLLRPLKK